MNLFSYKLSFYSINKLSFKKVILFLSFIFFILSNSLAYSQENMPDFPYDPEENATQKKRCAKICLKRRDACLKIEIDNKDLEVDGILRITEVLPGATDAKILDVDSKVPAGEKITTTIDFIYGAKYFATLTSSDGSSYQQVSEETVITCEEPVVIEPFDCAANPSLIQNL